MVYQKNAKPAGHFHTLDAEKLLDLIRRSEIIEDAMVHIIAKLAGGIQHYEFEKVIQFKDGESLPAGSYICSRAFVDAIEATQGIFEIPADVQEIIVLARKIVDHVDGLKLQSN